MERLSALGEMATTVAHETKNPLNAIKIATSYLKNNFHMSNSYGVPFHSRRRGIKA